MRVSFGVVEEKTFSQEGGEREREGIVSVTELSNWSAIGKTLDIHIYPHSHALTPTLLLPLQPRLKDRGSKGLYTVYVVQNTHSIP